MVDVAPHDLVGHKEAAAILGITKGRLSVWIARGRFIPPFTRLSSGPVWLREQVEAYARGRENL